MRIHPRTDAQPSVTLVDGARVPTSGRRPVEGYTRQQLDAAP